MLKVVFIMLTGVAVGRLLRSYSLRWLPKVTMSLIWCLLFLLGYEVAGDPLVSGSLGTFGIEALVLSAAGIAGSIVFSWLLWKMVTHRKEGRS